jgi:hypothetical protein
MKSEGGPKKPNCDAAEDEAKNKITMTIFSSFRGIPGKIILWLNVECFICFLQNEQMTFVFIITSLPLS